MMTNFKKIGLLVVSVMALFVITSDYAYGYLDPGTGSYILQILLAGLLGVGVGVKMFWSKIKAFFVKGKPAEADDTDDIDE